MKHTRNLYRYHVKKCMKNEHTIRKNRLLDACINGNGNIFEEVKKMRRSAPVVANSIDGHTEKIEEHFKDTYQTLYNCTDDREEMVDLQMEVENNINISHLYDVNKVTATVVKKAMDQLKNNKSDPVFLFSSDCIKNAPGMLSDLLAVIIRSFLLHGHVTNFLLIATLVPIVKNKLGCINSSKNYRSIAISSLVLKLLDWVTLELFGLRLGLDDLQYAYQEGASTTMCTWMVIETVGYFLRNGSEVFTCQTDMSKAFDMVKHSLLFRKLLNKGISRIFLRLYIFIYMFQYANVRWDGFYSSIFSLCNGVRQGAILSGILYCFYVNEIFEILRKKSIGCWINFNFMGMLGYSDDNWILAPTIDCLQEMLNTVENFCNDHNLKFSTDPDPLKCKTKCIAFLRRERPLPAVMLCGDRLPWVNSGVHLGNHFDSSYNGMARDTMTKRAQYIQKNCELLQEFSFAHPRTKILMNNMYNCHFTGCQLWDLFGKETEHFEKTWNVSVRKMLDLPVRTHKYLIEPISETKHLKRILIKRFISFILQIRKSFKSAPKQLLNLIYFDTRSITGNNVRKILRLTNKSRIEDIKNVDIEAIIYNEIPDAEKWRIGVINELSKVRTNEVEVPNFSLQEVQNMLEFVCVSWHLLHLYCNLLNL